MYKDNKSNTFKTIPFEINFDRTVDETVGLIDNIDDYDIIGFKLNLNEDIMEQLSNFSFAVSEMLSEFSCDRRDAYKHIMKGNNFHYSAYVTIPFYDFNKTNFTFGFTSDAGSTSSNICLSEKATADLRAEIERYLHTIGKDLKDMYEESRKEQPYEM